MLGILRRVFSFTDWTQHHPNEPPPGDMLDASFDAQNSRISELEQLILRVLREDGRLHNEIVTLDALAPDFLAKFNEILKESIKEVALRVTIPAENAIRAGDNALRDAEAAKIAAAEAKLAQNAISGARSVALAQIRAAVESGERLSVAIREAQAQLTASIDDWDDASSSAQAWAESSRLWAEHMPDTLPDNALKIMDITGEHWSARWWAHRADNAFGMLTDLYLGVHPTPPTTDNTGGPITIGSIYYDSTEEQTYIWDGSQWVSLAAPARAVTASLWYTATAGQTVFPLTVNDMRGNNFTLTSGEPEMVEALVNGVRMMPGDISIDGDWTLDVASSTVTFLRPLRAGDVACFDLLMPDTALGPGHVLNWALKPLVGQDGTNATFDLEVKASGGPAVTVTRYEDLLVSVDGVIQEPGVGYTATGDSITFVPAPAADSKVFITWMQSDGGTGLATMLKIPQAEPAAPIDGAIWIEGGELFVQIDGVARKVALA